MCKDALDHQDVVFTCSDCETRYHRACADELGGCSTLGCSARGVRPGRATGPTGAPPEVTQDWLSPEARGRRRSRGVVGHRLRTPGQRAWDEFSVFHFALGALVGGLLSWKLTEAIPGLARLGMASCIFLFFSLGAGFGRRRFWSATFRQRRR